MQFPKVLLQKQCFWVAGDPAVPSDPFLEQPIKFIIVSPFEFSEKVPLKRPHINACPYA